MKRFFKVFGWICLGIFLQFKFNILYGIVFLENLNFHDRTYIVEIKLNPVNDTLNIMNVKTTVHHSLGADYFATVYLPDQIRVLNLDPYKGGEVLNGYLAYKMNMKRKYRDVLATEDLIIAPQEGETKSEAEPVPIVVHFENLEQRLHTDNTFLISLKGDVVHVKGPTRSEARYPQKFGM